MKPVCAVSLKKLDPVHIQTIHQSCGHPNTVVCKISLPRGL